MSQLNTTDPRAVRTNNFKITMSQRLIDEHSKNVHEFPMAVLSKSMLGFDFDLDQEEDIDDEVDPDTVEDMDEDELLEHMVIREFGVLKLDYAVTRESLIEINKLIPVPDDCQFVVRIEYSDDGGNLAFYHEFRGVFSVPMVASGSRLDSGAIMINKLIMDCEEYMLFATTKRD